MLNLMEDDRNRQVSEEQKYQAGASEEPVESVYKPRALIFERQPTRYAWFAIDSSDDLKERDGIWKKVNKHNNISQNIYGTQRSGNVPIQSFKRRYNRPTNSLTQNKLTEYNTDKSETNVTCSKQRTRKRNIQKTNETAQRYGNKRIYLKEDNSVTKVNTAHESKYQDKNEIPKDEVTSYQVAKTTAEEGLKVEDSMEHRKSPPFTEAQNYVEHSDITNNITLAEQLSETHMFGAKSSDASDKPTESKHGLGKQDNMKLCASPEPADINNHFMTATGTKSTEKSGKTSSLQSQCLESNKLNDKNLIFSDTKENRIFGRTSDNISTLNTEAVKFTFGTNITDTPYKEAIVFSAKDRQKNQNETDALKQNTLKLRKPEETTHRNISDINECNERAQAIGENEYLSLEDKHEDQIKQNSGKEIFSQSIKPPRKDKYGFQRQNDVTVRPVVEKEQKYDAENQKISNEKDTTKWSLIPDINTENPETVCKTCLALQEAEKSNYKSFSVVIDTLTEVNKKPSKGNFICDEKHRSMKSDEKQDDIKTDEKHDATKTEFQKFTDEALHEKTEPYNFTNIQHEFNIISETEKRASSKENDLDTTKPEQVLTDDAIVSSSADKSACEEHAESSTISNILAAQQDSVECKYSVSSENSQVVESDSQPSAESLITEQKTKVKKHKRGWFIRLFSRLHKRKVKKGTECDVIATPSKSCS